MPTARRLFSRKVHAMNSPATPATRSGRDRPARSLTLVSLFLIALAGCNIAARRATEGAVVTRSSSITVARTPSTSGLAATRGR